MYLLTHSLSPVLVLVAVMDPKVLKTKISHTHSLIRSLILTLTHSHTHTQCLSLVLVVMIKSKELKTKISLTHSLILSHPLLSGQFRGATLLEPVGAGAKPCLVLDLDETLVHSQRKPCSEPAGSDFFDISFRFSRCFVAALSRKSALVACRSLAAASPCAAISSCICSCISGL